MKLGKKGRKDQDSVLSTLSCPETPMYQTLMSSLASRFKEGIFFFTVGRQDLLSLTVHELCLYLVNI